MEIIINECFGGFSLSHEGLSLYNAKRKASGKKRVQHSLDIKDRTDPLLVQVVRELGEKANGRCAKLVIKTIPLDYIGCYEIDEYDGGESLVLEPCKLVEYRLKQTNIAEITDAECRVLLQNLQDLVK